MKNGILLIVPILFVACVSNSKYEKTLVTIDSLKTENARLIQLNDELENGELRLAGLYSQYVNQGKFIEAEETYTNAITRHPLASSNTAYKNIDEIRKKAQIQRDSIEKALRDSLFLANIDDIGEWRIGNYVNDFEEPTGEHYVYQFIYGKFSNSATYRSELGVVIRIRKSRSRYSSSGIDYNIEFDEYNDGTKDASYFNFCKIVSQEQHKVYSNFKSYGGPFYDKDDEDTKYSFLDILRMGSTYKITASYREYSLTTTYEFTINSRYLNNALVIAGILTPSDVLNH